MNTSLPIEMCLSKSSFDPDPMPARKAFREINVCAGQHVL